MFSDDSTKLKYVLIGDIKKSTAVFTFAATNDAQTTYESHELLHQFSQKKTITNDRVQIKSREGYFYISIYYSEVFYLLFADLSIIPDKAFLILDKLHNYFQSKYGVYYKITEMDSHDKWNINEQIRRYESYFQNEKNEETFNESEVHSYKGEDNTLNRYGMIEHKKEFEIEKDEKDLNNEGIEIIIEDNKKKEDNNKTKKREVRIKKGIDIEKPHIKKGISSNQSNFIYNNNEYQNPNNNNEMKMTSTKYLQKESRDFLGIDDETNSTTEVSPQMRIVLIIIFTIVAIIPVIVIPIVLSQASDF